MLMNASRPIHRQEGLTANEHAKTAASQLPKTKPLLTFEFRGASKGTTNVFGESVSEGDSAILPASCPAEEGTRTDLQSFPLLPSLRAPCSRPARSTPIPTPE
ncbi:hypothetical protein AAFF_G00050990 [Aldrovandia affinis]|uniref:Uncharacterized protein n=1 Tax=Aldrovandia affinis TaxID=143900 RepID=A0AAD7T4C9_9TELE|nr:hypothetical protein AAFF_G00050990 [Aldrovandia affinis]